MLTDERTRKSKLSLNIQNVHETRLKVASVFEGLLLKTKLERRSEFEKKEKRSRLRCCSSTASSLDRSL